MSELGDPDIEMSLVPCEVIGYSVDAAETAVRHATFCSTPPFRNMPSCHRRLTHSRVIPPPMSDEMFISDDDLHTAWVFIYHGRDYFGLLHE